MKYRTLGSTGLRVSVIGVGTWQFGGEWGKNFEQGEVDGLLGRAKELGLNLIDTAECYGDHLSESLIGHAIRGQRNHWIVATKFGHQFHAHMNRTEPRTPSDVQRQLEASLRALQTDVIDLYQYHSWGDEQFDNEAVLDVLLQAKAAGKIRHIANSISKNDKTHQVSHAPDHQVEAIQVIYNRIDTKPEAEVFPLCQKLNLGVLARVPLASGFLTGKYPPGTRFTDPADVRSGQDPAVIEAKLRQVEHIQRTELPAGMALSQYALAWCLKHSAVTAVIPGCKDIAQLESNAAAANVDFVP